MEYTKELLLPKETLDRYNEILTTEPEDESECFGENETITETVKFENGYEMDIKICGVQFKEGESNLPWAEAVLFHNGNEVTFTEPSEDFKGEWWCKDDGNTFTVLVKAQ